MNISDTLSVNLRIVLKTQKELDEFDEYKEGLEAGETHCHHSYKKTPKFAG